MTYCSFIESSPAANLAICEHQESYMARSNTAVTLINRRAVIRYRCDPQAKGRVFINESYKCQPAQMVDLSLSGIGLLIGEPIEPGTVVSIEVNEGVHTATMELHGQVAFCTAAENGSWRCGCQLLTELSKDEVEVLLR